LPLVNDVEELVEHSTRSFNYVFQYPYFHSFLSFIAFFAMASPLKLFLFILVYSTSAGNTKAFDSLAPLAISAIINENLAKDVREIELVNFGITNGQGERTMEKLLKLEKQSVSMRITSDNPHLDVFYLIKPTILLFDSPENFNRTQNRIMFQYGFKFSYQHIVYIPNSTMNDIRIVSYKNHTIDKTIFLLNENESSVELATSFMVTREACWKSQFKIINRFSRQQKRWENSDFFVEKYKNFHGCPLEFKYSTDLSIDFANQFRKILNFTIKYSNEWVHLHHNISFAYDLSFGVSDILSEFIMHTIPRKIYIPPGELYGEYEKMVLPFDTFTWIGIILTIFLSVGGILMIKWLMTRQQEIYFGRNNHSPLMNFVDIILNGSQVTNLIQNTPRIFLLTMLFWSLVFR
jgi:hypothetical protein